jgi:hypothetical protein
MIEDMRPGRYRLRNGIVATVSESNDTLHPPFFWVGSVAGEIEVWDRRGRHQSNGKESPWDLVARIPDETPADDRIQRALQVLRETCNDENENDWWEAVLFAIQILESTP